MVHRVGIALGSNLGDRLGCLCAARDLLFDLAVGGSDVLVAPVYETEPVACADGVGDFYNTVIEVGYEGDPFGLLVETQRIERELGRCVVRERNAPREIDVDILYFGDVVVREADLCVPHLGLLERRFVLEPLSDIRPDLVLAGEELSVSEHLAGLESGESPLRLVQRDW